jgi:CBS-domain-containing membrane protein
MLISEIYHKNPLTVSQDQIVSEVVSLLDAEECNASIVLDEKGDVVGVLAIQDIAKAILPDEYENNIEMAMGMYTKGFFHRLCSEVKNMKVKDIMRTDYRVVDLETNILVVLAELVSNDLHLLPVIEKGELLGVVTRTQVKHAMLKIMNGKD